MADNNEKPLSYLTRLGLVMKATWISIPVVAFSGYAFADGRREGVWIALGLFFAGVHWYVVTHKGNIKKELKDMSKRELRERGERLETDLYHANNAIKSRDSMLEIYRSDERDSDLRYEVLSEVRNALEAYDQSPSPVRAMASLELLRGNLKRLGRDYFED
jgi:hypothetical protein